ncbi:MAG: 4-hydroxyphenylacetate decarboxylase activase [Dethiobacteria bacterium]|jgi:pyruvate formate lyase activating enzyme|nr:4-hydroxyphenylacetate decarboxylase activase [Bacillota bacterium]NMD33186.1 4-hydroxyphenylacetate decarboxylase activase [Bacillota bacterium]HOB29198.1 4-hydroxyphenylacetate decarboxylase activase [Bacillota bacterium]HPZ41810.1 4-hydroxyphenylacetate decarboxylase activase [Bacillota bacterium]HQD52679.1 4-hydroxyphenylacetate decarboxylase activase [Bacillota bacterium]
MEETGLIFDIQGHSVHDGPGSRTLVFLSGCPLRCEWCSNPEGMELRQRIRFREKNCVTLKQDCTRCADACPYNAITFNRDNEIPLEIDRQLCRNCDSLDCAKACLKEALIISGKKMTVTELMTILNRDRQFWGPEGGVSFTGGEPLFQKRFIIQVLQKCCEAYLHTVIETSAYVETEHFLKAMSMIEFAFIDLKHMDPEKHKEKTGVSNKLIHKNIKALANSNWPGRLIIRMPIIENFNDSEENILATASFLKEVGLDEINILPFHRLGDSKWTQLGLTYPYRDYKEPPAEKMEYIQQLFLDQNLACYNGYRTPF